MNKKKVFLVVLAVVVVGGVLVYRWMGEGGTSNPPQAGAPRTEALPVVVALVQERSFEDAVRVQANLQAETFALVSPRVAGVLETVLVEEGQTVEAGVTPLFQTDGLTLEKNLEMAKQDLKIKRLARAEQAAELRRIDVERRRKASVSQRFAKLYESRTVSLNEYEDKRMEADQLIADRDKTQSSLELAAEQERRAATALEVAEKNFRDARILAPISGRVTKRMAEPGEMGSPGSPVIRIDDVGHLEVSAFLPGDYYGRVVPGNTRVRIGSGGQAWGEYELSYKSPTVDSTLRTFEIKCRVNGDGRGLVPGALVDLTVILAKRNHPGVPTSALVQRKDGAVIFLAENDHARRMAVDIGLESDGWIEILSQGLPPDARVVVRGQSWLEDGRPIRIQEGAM